MTTSTKTLYIIGGTMGVGKTAVCQRLKHEQGIIDAILENVNTANCATKTISLVCAPDTLRARLEGDIRSGLRTGDVIERSIERLPLYEKLQTEKIITDGKGIDDIAGEILRL